MIEKALLDKLLGRIKVSGLDVTYWDSDTRHYGQADSLVHIVIHHPRAVRAMVKQLTLGFGESYINGDIDITGPLENIGKLASLNQSVFDSRILSNLPHPRRRNHIGRQASQIQHHYDVGNDFYRLWLDESMTYSCAYFKSPTDTLEQAQSQKLDHVLRKLQLSPGQTLLDIGSGWGQLLIRAAQDYGVRGHGITLSHEQLKLSQEKSKALGLDQLLTFELVNYQDLAGRGLVFDRIVSVGMYEHVGRRNHAAYFRAVHGMLADGGVSLLHTITNEVELASDAFIDKYIFPGGYIPSLRETVDRLPGYNLRLQDYENLRLHYAMTTEAWLERFEAHRAAIVALYDERFYRMWRIYLAGSASGFRYDDLSLSQLVFTKGLNNELSLTRDYLYPA